jgi:hypothetical protein
VLNFGELTIKRKAQTFDVPVGFSGSLAASHPHTLAPHRKEKLTPEKYIESLVSESKDK